MQSLIPLLAQESSRLEWAKMPDLGRMLPEAFLCLWVVVILLTDLVRGRGASPLFPVLSIVGCVIAAVLVIAAPTTGPSVGYGGVGALQPDGVAKVFKLVFLATGLLTVLFMRRSGDAYAREPELHVILFGALAGMCYLASATELIGFYLSFEMVSYTGFLMASYRADSARSAEAGVKFVLFGAVASAVMLFGLSLVYGYAGSTQFSVIATKLQAAEGQPVLWLAAVLVFAGFAFKAAAFPMQFWCPDVYEGAPAPVAGFLAVASKAAVFSAGVRVLMLGIGDATLPTATELFAAHGSTVRIVLICASVATMCWGNFAALRQESFQRMLAYSAIAQAGYLIMTAAVVVPGTPAGRDAIAAILVYFVLYLLMTLAAFFVVTLMRRDAGTADIAALRGTGSSHPILAACLTLTLLSLTGLPPTAGFVGKLQLFAPVVREGYYVLATVGLVNGAVSLYYYWKPVREMYLRDAEGGSRLRPAVADTAIVAVLSVPLLVLGLGFWDVLTQAALDAVTWKVS